MATAMVLFSGMDTLQIYFRINLIRDRLEWRILRILPDLRGVEQCATDRLHNTLPPHTL
jgi:hypothetical protein